MSGSGFPDSMVARFPKLTVQNTRSGFREDVPSSASRHAIKALLSLDDTQFQPPITGNTPKMSAEARVSPDSRGRVVAEASNNLGSILHRMPEELLIMVVSNLRPVGQELLKRTCRKMLRICSDRVVREKHLSEHWQSRLRNAGGSFREYHLFLNDQETAMLRDILMRDSLCSPCREFRGDTQRFRRAIEMATRPMKCSLCRLKHPALLFSEKELPKDNRVCIGQQGHVSVCEHNKTGWLDICCQGVRNPHCYVIGTWTRDCAACPAKQFKDGPYPPSNTFPKLPVPKELHHSESFSFCQGPSSAEYFESYSSEIVCERREKQIVRSSLTRSRHGSTAVVLSTTPKFDFDDIFTVTTEKGDEYFIQGDDFEISTQFAFTLTGLTNENVRSEVINSLLSFDQENDSIYCPHLSRGNGPGAQVALSILRGYCTCFPGAAEYPKGLCPVHVNKHGEATGVQICTERSCGCFLNFQTDWRPRTRQHRRRRLPPQQECNIWIRVGKYVKTNTPESAEWLSALDPASYMPRDEHTRGITWCDDPRCPTSHRNIARSRVFQWAALRYTRRGQDGLADFEPYKHLFEATGGDPRKHFSFWDAYDKRFNFWSCIDAHLSPEALQWKPPAIEPGTTDTQSEDEQTDESDEDEQTDTQSEDEWEEVSVEYEWTDAWTDASDED
ncbi:hypothetical protein KJ359_010956 [Pestalotiopsis sp. 9143b]|nr:hypothetical protein KJ359_010956 [Pestalotiopsis sp. 9143b]